MITAKFQNVIEEPWLSLEPIRVGIVPAGMGTPEVYVTIELNDIPHQCVYVYVDTGVETLMFHQVIVWKKWVVIGYGYKVYLIPVNGENPRTILFSSYFGHLYPYEDLLLAASGRELVCIDTDGKERWIAEELGLDGVIVDKIDNEIVYGQGEWDPPGGWHPFKVKLSSGTLLNVISSYLGEVRKLIFA